MIEDKRERGAIAAEIAELINQLARKCLRRGSQEPSITAKIAEQLEKELNGRVIGESRIDVVAHDLPDRGRGSLEKKTGVDLYIGIRVTSADGRIVKRKGLLVQSKKVGARHTDKLDDQCEKMTECSMNGSYIWIYGIGGTEVFRANEILSNSDAPLSSFESKSLREHFEGIFECLDGDVNLASDRSIDEPEYIEVFLREVAPKTKLTFDIKRGSEKLPHKKLDPYVTSVRLRSQGIRKAR